MEIFKLDDGKEIKAFHINELINEIINNLEIDCRQRGRLDLIDSEIANLKIIASKEREK
ncbi:hypothetical protein H0I68_16090 [Yersinia kristensenii]|uniref:hypothetical protein n=1 Tax=Yersinia kristensenii TaxID=28152 RepID=UPI001C60E6CA|nr:hypothetical protein [Yersinia kristensenii]MBW5826563.1 hypothetical protein [Yersinia kristensenii]